MRVRIIVSQRGLARMGLHPGTVWVRYDGPQDEPEAVWVRAPNDHNGYSPGYIKLDPREFEEFEEKGAKSP